ncbi:alpha/beta-hydrolase [Polyplosphaeria fusca]|uniref:Carboxylic ester hydrolase n=1 Tax=Polyplosphaeria fusca TaxID=682080 RepID=A0A9P4QYP3_9PLEO|nr:alpha/beta-hydrolase [Polyplosphaeria fusca]
MTGLLDENDVVQFRNIPFATIPARFKRSVLLTHFLDTDRNFTKRGYASPQAIPTVPDLFSGGPYPNESSTFQYSETECLNLQINVPISLLQSTHSKVPLLVYVHGGGFVLGKIDAQHSTHLMVSQSVSDNQPVIGANIQYRLGALGYLHTSTADSNIAMHDQRNALLWIQTFAGGFGGDVGRVTVFGESAGAMSICYHMMAPAPSTGPLFQRAVLMSGVVGPMTAPMPVKEAEKLCDEFMDSLGIKEKSEAGLEWLRILDVQEIVDKSSKLTEQGTMWIPTQDEEWFGKEAGDVTWDRGLELIGKCEWVDAILLGTTGFEGTTLLAAVAGLTPKSFVKGVADQLGEQSANLLKKAYKLSDSMDQNLFLTRAMEWIGDVVFSTPAHALCRHVSTSTNANKKIYRYIFDARNPFPGSPCYQHPHHWVDIYYVFKTFQFRYPHQRLKDLSTRHAQLWIDFTNGKSPWSEYRYDEGGNATFMIADEREGWIQRSAKQDENLCGRDWARCELLWESWKGMQGKWFQPLKIEPMRKSKVV